MEGGILTIVILMFMAAILVGIAQKIHIPYPIALVIGGTAIGFTPNLKPISIDPELILVLVLPPLLYYASFGVAFREFKHNIKEIVSLALGLVLLTTLVIGVIFKWIFPNTSWALAFAFGAIVSPPDAVAATAILKRFAISPRLQAILEGESLINDASALVLYKVATTALLYGIFSLAEVSIEFIQVISGGIIVGVIFGYVLQNFSRNYLEPVVAVLFSFTIPYITYITADYFGFSGVLAVVTNGLVGSKILVRHHSPLRRVLGFAAWDIFSILMNCFVFVLIGLQLRALSTHITAEKMLVYSGYAAIFTFAMLAIRMVWVYAKDGIFFLTHYNQDDSKNHYLEKFKEDTLIGWSGMRGIVSLAAVLALPITYPDGTPLEGRDEVIFITFVVILLTLLIPGFTLPYLIRFLNISHHTEQADLIKVRKHLTIVADETAQLLHFSKKINDEELEFLQVYLNLQHKNLNALENNNSQRLETIKSLLIQEKRKKLFKLWESDEINDKMLVQMEHELDLEETHFTRAELK